METNINLRADMLAEAQSQLRDFAHEGAVSRSEAYRLAFADTDFLLSRETRGIRFQLEMLKPELGQAAQGIENTVVVFGSARFATPEAAQQHMKQAQASGDADQMTAAQRAMKQAHWYTQACTFARLVAQYSESQPQAQRLYVCTGGGPGIMEAANRGAHEAGALNVGLNITLPHEQSGNRYITPSLCYKFHYFALRKMHFIMRAKALVVFPGGFGTLDELFEVLTLVQTGKVKQVPIVLFGKAFWQRLLHWDVLIEEGTISAEDLKLFHYTDDPQEAWALIRAFYGW